jgi:hypothetical protein
MMSHLVFKPLRIVQPTYSVGARIDPVEKIGDEHLIISHFFTTNIEDGNEASNTFLLSDVVIGETVLGGVTTRGLFELGVVTGYSKGWCFFFNGVNAGSRLWGDLLLIKGPLADAARARYKVYEDYTSDGEAPAPPLKRTDSGSNYGHWGIPDLEFWTRSGFQPWYIVMHQDYNHWKETPQELASRIDELTAMHEDTHTELQRRALDHVITTLRARLPPPRAATPPPRAPERLEPPPAPRKASDNFCPIAQDNKHTYGPARTVGYSWHSPVMAADCTLCGYNFCDH